MVYIIPNFLVIHFGENPIKNTKVTDEWKSALNVNENMQFFMSFLVDN